MFINPHIKGKADAAGRSGEEPGADSLEAPRGVQVHPTPLNF